MSNEQLHYEIATRNAMAAVKDVSDVKRELIPRIIHLENLVSNLNNKLALLEQKYNLLLSERFNGGPTSGNIS